MNRLHIKNAAAAAGLLLITMGVRGQNVDPMENLSPEEQEASEPASQPTTTPAEETKKAPAFFRLDYSGDFLTAPAATGDWGGLRNTLAEQGISFNVEVLQFGLGNAYGGRDTNDGFQYSGSADYILQLDTGRLGLWPGGLFKFRGETGFGRGINSLAGAVSPVNFDALFPEPHDSGLTTLTEAWYLQFLSPKLYILGGKIDPSRLHGQNVFTSDPYGQFLNTSLWQPPNSFALVPYTAWMAGVGYIPTSWLSGATLVMDSYSKVTRTGFETAFHSPNGATVLQALTFHVEPFGLKGHQRLNAAWSSRDRVRIQDLDRLFLATATEPSFSRLEVRQRITNPFPRLKRPKFIRKGIVSRTLEPDPKSDDWAFWYDFDQYFYQEPQDPTQGIGLFGKFGWSPGETNPVATYYSIGIGGKGIIPRRDKDRFGIGYYMLNLSEDFPGLFNANAEQGVELFYNIEVTPWFHLTPDVQVIVDSGGSDRDEPAIVYGIRGQLSF